MFKLTFLKGKKLHLTSFTFIAFIVFAYFVKIDTYTLFLVFLLYTTLRDMAFRDALASLEKRIK